MIIMSTILILAITLVTIVSLILRIATPRAAEERRKLPPGPRPLPIIGNLHMLTALPHRALRDLSRTHGPIMFLRLGKVPAVVLSSPHAARLFLKTHDAVFASRPHSEVSDHLSYGTKGMGFTAYGPYWRGVRRLCTTQLLSPAKTELFGPSRRELMAALVAELRESAAVGEVVDLTRRVGELVVDMSCRMILGKQFEDRYRFRELVHEALCLLGSFNIADFIPSLSPLDPQGFSRKMKKINKEIDKVLEKIIMEHEVVENKQQYYEEDFVHLLLSSINKPTNLNDEHATMFDRTNIKAILLDLIIASFDTSSTSIDWTLSELLKNPRVMKTLQEELEHIIGLDKMVEEKDLEKLQYLDMVVKESFRLHPVAPLLIPRESMEDMTIEGYHIPKKARIIVNNWALGRDPIVWSEKTEEFYPERFRERDVNYLRGQDFSMLPFGSGRRGCPGVYVGIVTVRFVVAQLMHCFSWELPDGVEANDIDMTEKFGLSMGRGDDHHLLAKPTFRLLDY